MGDVGRGVYCAMNLQLGVYNPTKFEICETPPKTMRLLKPKAEIHLMGGANNPSTLVRRRL